MIGTTGATGSVNYVEDSTQPGGYRQVTSLSQPEQQTYDLSKAAQNGALGVANDQIGRVSGALATPLDTSGLPALSGSTPAGGIQSSFNMGGPLQYSFDPGQQVQGQVGPQNFNQATQQAADAVYGQATSRLDPQWATAQNQEETKLANQGLGQNSDAYKNAMDTFNRSKTDAYNQANYSAIGAGQNEQNTLFGQQLQQGTFANQAAGQQYAQNQGQAGFNNSTAGQDYSQNQGAAAFANTAQQQQFQQQQAQAALDNAARSQGLQERAYVQNQPINQLTGLLGLGQVAQPQGINYTPSQVGQTDVTGAYALQTQAQQAAAQRAAQSQSGLMSGLLGLGAAALAPATGGASMFAISDRRLKRNIRKVGERPDGLGIYEFDYIWPGPRQIGVMADEVLKVKPAAVLRMDSGYLAVDYGAL